MEDPNSEKAPVGAGALSEDIEPESSTIVAEWFGGNKAGAPEPSTPPVADFIRTRELPAPWLGTILSLPSPVAGLHVDRAVLWETPPELRERHRTFQILRALHQRQLLPPGALIIAKLEGGLSIGVDAPCPERFAQYQRRLAEVQWAWAPWEIHACRFDEGLSRLAETLGLGDVYPADTRVPR